MSVCKKKLLLLVSSALVSGSAWGQEIIVDSISPETATPPRPSTGGSVGALTDEIVVTALMRLAGVFRGGSY